MSANVTYKIDPQPGVMDGTWWNVALGSVVVADGVVTGVSEGARAEALGLSKVVAEALARFYDSGAPTPAPVDAPSAPVVLVACGKGKRKRTCRAADLYTGPHYNLRCLWAREVKGVEPAGILSAKHGLLHPDAQVAPYDATLGEMSKGDRDIWSREVLFEVYRRWPVGTEITVLAGTPYVEGWAEAASRSRTVIHRKFKGIGYERKALADEVKDAIAAVTAKGSEGTQVGLF